MSPKQQQQQQQQQQNQTSPFQPTCLNGKIALITGGGSGIGYEITKQLLHHGCTGIIICGRRATFLQKACDALNNNINNHGGGGRRCLYHTCDVRDPEQCRIVVHYAISQFGRLDVLINGAAGNFLSEAGRGLSPKGFRTVMEIDAIGTYNMSHAAYPHLKRRQRDDPLSEHEEITTTSLILNISATLQYGATWYQAHASAAKSAVDSLTRSLALEWGMDGIRVCGIAPGPIRDTPGMTKLAPGILPSGDGDDDDDEEMIREGIPLGRLGYAFDIAMAAVFLSSDGGGSYITGDVLVVDGGQWLYKPPLIPREMVAALARDVEKKSRDQVPPQFRSKL